LPHDAHDAARSSAGSGRWCDGLFEQTCPLAEVGQIEPDTPVSGYVTGINYPKLHTLIVGWSVRRATFKTINPARRTYQEHEVPFRNLVWMRAKREAKVSQLQPLNTTYTALLFASAPQCALGTFHR